MCPPEVAAGFEILKTKAERGEDLSAHQSKKLLDAKFNDHLLNDWGIHHFHLGTDVDTGSPSFVKRTELLLFARLTDDSVFLIDISRHGAWSDQRLVEIMHANWPDSIERYRLRGILGLERVVTNEDRERLREAGALTFVQLADGTVYAPIGGGYSSSGLGIDVVRKSGYYAQRVRNLEAQVKAQSDAFIARIRDTGLSSGTPTRFRLLVDAKGAHAVEEQSRKAFFLGRL